MRFGCVRCQRYSSVHWLSIRLAVAAMSFQTMEAQVHKTLKAHLHPEVGEARQRLQENETSTGNLPAALQVQASQGIQASQCSQATVAHVAAVLQGNGRQEWHLPPPTEALACTQSF